MFDEFGPRGAEDEREGFWTDCPTRAGAVWPGNRAAGGDLKNVGARHASPAALRGNPFPGGGCKPAGRACPAPT